MTMKSQFDKIAKQMNSHWRKGVQRALSKSGKQAKTFWVKEVRDFTGIKLRDVNKRLKQFKTKSLASKGIFSTELGMATKVGLPIRLLKPRSKKINTPRGKNTQVSYQLGGSGRTIALGAFMNKKNGNKFVARRKGVARFPTVEAKLIPDVLYGWGIKIAPTIKNFLRETFDRIANHEIEFEFKRILGKK